MRRHRASGDEMVRGIDCIVHVNLIIVVGYDETLGLLCSRLSAIGEIAPEYTL